MNDIASYESAQVLPARSGRELRRQQEYLFNAQMESQITAAQITGMAFVANHGMILTAQLAKTAQEIKELAPTAGAEIDMWRHTFQVAGLRLLSEMGHADD